MGEKFKSGSRSKQNINLVDYFKLCTTYANIFVALPLNSLLWLAGKQQDWLPARYVYPPTPRSYIFGWQPDLKKRFVWR